MTKLFVSVREKISIQSDIVRQLGTPTLPFVLHAGDWESVPGRDTL